MCAFGSLQLVYFLGNWRSLSVIFKKCCENILLLIDFSTAYINSILWFQWALLDPPTAPPAPTCICCCRCFCWEGSKTPHPLIQQNSRRLQFPNWREWSVTADAGATCKEGMALINRNTYEANCCWEQHLGDDVSFEDGINAFMFR